jgi:hypothetical protein
MQRRAGRRARANCGMTCDLLLSFCSISTVSPIWPRIIHKTFPALVGHRHVLLPAINILLISPHTNDRRLCLKTAIASSEIEIIHTRTIFDILTCLSNSFPTPTKDSNSWYHPSLEGASGDEAESIDVAKGNWGRKTAKGARWLRKGKLAAWGPGMEEWEVRFWQFLSVFND